MTENLKGKMGHKMNHFNVGKGHPIEEIILYCINFNILCPKALNACTLSTTFHFVKKSTFPPCSLPTPSFNEIGVFEWPPPPPPHSLSSWKTIESDFTEKSDPINFPEPIKIRTRIVVKSGPNNVKSDQISQQFEPDYDLKYRTRLLQFGSDLSSCPK